MRGLIPALALQALGCGEDGDRNRYLDDVMFRRARLEASIVNPDNGYSRLRLAHYGRDWEALPEWNPPVAVVAADGALLDDAPLDLTSSRLGEQAFFRYPAQLAPYLVAPLDAIKLAELGFWSDPSRGLGGLVSVRFADGTRGYALSCAVCHARVANEVLLAGLPNQDFNLGALVGESWGKGRIDVAPSPEEPVAIPDLRATGAETHLHRDGTLRNDPIALAIRIETLIITAHGESIRPPRMVALALAEYLASLLPTTNAALHSRGGAIFTAHCAGCHVPPELSGPPVPLATIGTDPRVGHSPDRGTIGYRIPSLLGVGTRGRLLHDGSAPDLLSLFDPARLDGRVPIGHHFGLDLGDADRARLIDWLSGL